MQLNRMLLATAANTTLWGSPLYMNSLLTRFSNRIELED